MGLFTLYILLKGCNALFLDLGLAGASEICATWANYVGWAIVVCIPLLILGALVNPKKERM